MAEGQDDAAQQGCRQSREAIREQSLEQGANDGFGTKDEVEIGSVEMLGQRMTIRTITAEWLPSPHRLFKYKYEVLSKGSKFFGKVDIAFSTETLLHRHNYVVLVNRDTANPRIVRVLKELPKADGTAP